MNSAVVQLLLHTPNACGKFSVECLLFLYAFLLWKPTDLSTVLWIFILPAKLQVIHFTLQIQPCLLPLNKMKASIPCAQDNAFHSSKTSAGAVWFSILMHREGWVSKYSFCLSPIYSAVAQLSVMYQTHIKAMFSFSACTRTNS